MKRGLPKVIYVIRAVDDPDVLIADESLFPLAMEDEVIAGVYQLIETKRIKLTVWVEAMKMTPRPLAKELQ